MRGFPDRETPPAPKNFGVVWSRSLGHAPRRKMKGTRGFDGVIESCRYHDLMFLFVKSVASGYFLLADGFSDP
jgi:hypothetical protein